LMLGYTFLVLSPSTDCDGRNDAMDECSKIIVQGV
jgi:hypothetical protein